MLLEQILGPEEKILIASGEKWELNIPRKLLLGVTEMCLLHLRREQIVQKTQALSLNTLACLKCLRFLFNDFSSLKQVRCCSYSSDPAMNYIPLLYCRLSSFQRFLAP